jgi:hypothetical protein
MNILLKSQSKNDFIYPKARANSKEISLQNKAYRFTLLKYKKQTFLEVLF